MVDCWVLPYPKLLWAVLSASSSQPSESGDSKEMEDHKKLMLKRDRRRPKPESWLILHAEAPVWVWVVSLLLGVGILVATFLGGIK